MTKKKEGKYINRNKCEKEKAIVKFLFVNESTKQEKSKNLLVFAQYSVFKFDVRKKIK